MAAQSQWPRRGQSIPSLTTSTESSQPSVPPEALTTDVEPLGAVSVPEAPPWGTSRGFVAAASAVSIGKRATLQLKDKPWHEDAWEMYDTVGEYHFIVRTIADMVGRGKPKVVVRAPDGGVDVDPTLTEELYRMVGGRAAAVRKLSDLVVGLIAVGEGYWEVDVDPNDPALVPKPVMLVRSRRDFETLGSGETATVSRREEDGSKTLLPSNHRLYRVWYPHPHVLGETDCPTRAALPVLRELVALTMHVGAQIDSRLAGAGVFIVPDSARALQKASPDDEEEPVTVLLGDVLVDAMITPIRDRDSAGAVTPLVITIPTGDAAAFRHLTFSTPLDAEARALRDEAIRRLAMAMDCPPELLLGTGGLNHWSAWLMREDVISTHVTPYAETLADALTTLWLRPLVAGLGKDPEGYSVEISLDDLVLRPDRSAEAQALFDRDAITEEALRQANGFSEDDAPEPLSRTTHDQAVEMALEMLAKAPSLLQQVYSIPDLVTQIEAAIDGTEYTPPTAVETVDETIEVVEEDAPEGSSPTSSGGPGGVSVGGPPS